MGTNWKFQCLNKVLIDKVKVLWTIYYIGIESIILSDDFIKIFVKIIDAVFDFQNKYLYGPTMNAKLIIQCQKHCHLHHFVLILYS